MDTNIRLNALNIANEQLLHKFHQKYAALSNIVNEENAAEIVPVVLQYIEENYPSFDEISKRAAEVENFLGNHEPSGDR